MQQILRETTGQEETCVYLPDRQARMRYRLIDRCHAETYQQMLDRGWRRFGRVFFRHACAPCEECRSLRVDVAEFAPNRSMRRTLRRNRDLRLVLRPASISEDHLRLYRRYHYDMAERKGWPDKEITPVGYYQTFCEGKEDFGHELLFLLDERLVAVALVDLLPRAVSAVYCYYEPEMRARSLGVFSVLQQVELARRRSLPYLYLGYWIDGNASMRYKANYRPHEILEGRPKLADEAVWRTWTQKSVATDSRTGGDGPRSSAEG